MYTMNTGDILSSFENNFVEDSIRKILSSKLIKKTLLPFIPGVVESTKHTLGYAEWKLPVLFRKPELFRYIRMSRLLLLVIISFLSTSFVPNRSKHYALTCVVIDAGHGGHDSGCLGSKTKEKDVALSVALKLGKYIEDNFKDVKVIYTRKTDVFVELHERASIANNAHADLFICIHCNSASARDVDGPETWVMGLHRSEANLEVAKRENEVVLLEKDYTKRYDGFDPNSPEANIIFSLYQNAYLDQSLKMASLVQQEMKTNGRAGRGVKQAGFLVLYKTSMPSILVETGFLTNKEEEKYLASAKGQDEIAGSIFHAFKNYKSSVEINSSSEEDKEDKPDSAVNKENNEAKPEKKTNEPVNENAEGNSKDNSQKKDGIKYPGIPKPKNEELFFAVQIVLSPKALPKDSQKFKGEKNIHEEKADGMYKYSTGKFLLIADAIDCQAKMREKGFKDAFVVAFKNGSRITIKEAREIIQKK
jgi:N-acetylmuramoyl-L-alanine amidase